MTDLIIKAFFEVYNQLGYGFLEKVYANALQNELANAGLKIESQYPIQVFYHDKLVGEYIADLVVDGLIIIGIKAAKAVALDHEAQLLNYLKATACEVGLLLNFGPKAEFKRKVFENSRKHVLNPRKSASKKKV
ncbi:MAG TPA: GxxExxY protein [Nitrospirota bacterium]|nr:GxxExxY protein [Nitrospirota bacterium]